VQVIRVEGPDDAGRWEVVFQDTVGRRFWALVAPTGHVFDADTLEPIHSVELELELMRAWAMYLQARALVTGERNHVFVR